MNTREDSCHVICGTPTVLQNVETQLTSSVYIRVEHLADKFHTRRLVRVLLLKVHHQAECAILKRCIGGANDDGIPRKENETFVLND